MVDAKILKVALFLLALALSGCAGARVGKPPPCPRPGPKIAEELTAVEGAPEFWRWMALFENYCDGIDALRGR